MVDWWILIGYGDGLMQINTALFCSLARNQDWLSWLTEHAPDLCQQLMQINQQSGCKPVRAHMDGLIDILLERGLHDELEMFLIHYFPFMVRNKPSNSTTWPFKNEVFGFYNHRILTFPRRMILCHDDINELNRRIENFTRDKLGVDFVIVDRCAYIEYFERQHRDIMIKIKPEDREVYRYKKNIAVA